MNPIYRKKGNPETFLAAYDRTLAHWSVCPEELDIDTYFGRTHVLAAGPKDGEPLVLFHGFGFSSTTWIENIGELSRHYRVYAVDFVGDINKSEMKRPIRDPQDCAVWFSDLLIKFGLSWAHVGGHSYGGFVAMLLAARLPERIGKLLVLSPGAALQPQSKRFFVKCMIAGMMPSNERLEKFMTYMTGKGNEVNRLVKDQFIAAMQNALPRNKLFAAYLPDEEIQRIKAPTLVLIGDQDVQYDAREAVQRALALMPRVEAHVIPDTGHGLPLERPDVVNRMMLSFLSNGPQSSKISV